MLATQLSIDTTAVTHIFDGIEAAAHCVIVQVGGMSSVVKGAKSAVRKPNFVADRSAETGSRTHVVSTVTMNLKTLSVNPRSLLRVLPGECHQRQGLLRNRGILA